MTGQGRMLIKNRAEQLIVAKRRCCGGGLVPPDCSMGEERKLDELPFAGMKLVLGRRQHKDQRENNQD